jgi:hypothetical protein
MIKTYNFKISMFKRNIFFFLNDLIGAGIGVDGVHASLAGFGFRVGPRMEIKTPVVDVSCSIM